MAESYAGSAMRWMQTCASIRYDSSMLCWIRRQAMRLWSIFNCCALSSAIAILCCLYDEWCEFRVLITGGRYREAILSSRLSATPDVEQVAQTALARREMTLEDPWFDTALRRSTANTSPTISRDWLGRQRFSRSPLRRPADRPGVAEGVAKDAVAVAQRWSAMSRTGSAPPTVMARVHQASGSAT